jgi:hypothetical protein
LIGRETFYRNTEWEIPVATLRFSFEYERACIGSCDETAMKNEHILGGMHKATPKPCKRFSKRIPVNDKFIAHLPECEACRAVVEYLVRESERDLFLKKSRN